MDWRKKLFKLPGRMTKENWIVLLCLGLIIMIIAMPWSEKAEKNQDEHPINDKFSAGFSETDSFASYKMPDSYETHDSYEVPVSYEALASYETVLEQRVKEVLKRVEGVGTVDVLIVLKSSEERIYRTDGKTSQASTKEVDSAGGSREISEQEEERTTVLSAGGGGSLGEQGSTPLLEKELRPEISGIVISAQGGGSPTIKAEITEAMEALFDLPAHKIKVLKRVE